MSKNSLSNDFRYSSTGTFYEALKTGQNFKYLLASYLAKEL
jgi:hypothetical protein